MVAKIKVLFALGGTFHNGGTEAVVFGIYKFIDKQKFQIDFLLQGKKEEDISAESKRLENEGARIHYVIPRRISFTKNLKEIENVLRDNCYDIIHSHMDAIGADILRLAKKNGVRVRISHSHNTDHILNSKGFKKKLHRLFVEVERFKLRRYATDFIACSSEAGEWLFGVKKCQGNHYMIYRNAIETSKFAFSEETRERKREEMGVTNCKVIGHVGSFNQYKNHRFLIQLFSQICMREDNVKLVLVGEGELKQEIEEQICNLNLNDKVIFLGNRNDVNELMQAFDVFVLPSRHEGLALVLIEAQASGLKCFVSDAVTRESNVTGKVDFISINDSFDIWSDKILGFLQKEVQRDNTIDIIQEKGYELSTNVKTLENFYIKCMKQNKFY